MTQRISVTSYFPTSRIIKLSPAKKEFDKLCTFIGKSFYYDELNNVQPLGPGLYGASHFYKGHEKYYLPKTCNVWTAKALQQAGYPISPSCLFRAESLMKRIEEYGTVLR